MEDKNSNTESENLGRGFRKKMIPNRFEKENGNFYFGKIFVSLITFLILHRNKYILYVFTDNCSNSSKTDEEEASSDNDSIPDKTLDEQGIITLMQFIIINVFKCEKYFMKIDFLLHMYLLLHTCI